MKKNYLEDLKEIRDIMDRSTRFISLSGLSGISAGAIALVGVYFAYQQIFKRQDYWVYRPAELGYEVLAPLLAIATGTLILALGAAIFFTTQKTKSANHSIWNPQVKRLLINLFIPLISGGLLCLILLSRGFLGFLPALTLVFYGLGLVNASKYTLQEIRSLGLFEILLGLIALQFLSYSLLLWGLGFGVLHILYGFFIQWKYKP